MKVSVTAEDLAYGSRGNARRCPVARAVNRAVFDRAGVSYVGSNDVVISFPHEGGKAEVYPLPPLARQKIVLFDAARHVLPFEFELNEQLVMEV